MISRKIREIKTSVLNFLILLNNVNWWLKTNFRIKSIDDKNVIFSRLDYRTSKTSELTLTGQEFVRRWSKHILPERFVKVKHYGILSSRSKMKVRDIVCEYPEKEPPVVKKGMKWFSVYFEICGESSFLCPA